MMKEKNHSRFGLLNPSILCMVLMICLLQSDHVIKGDSTANNKALCNTDLSSFLPLPYSNLPNLICNPLWNSFLLRYSQSKDCVITIILSAPYTTGWVGIGFSKDGMMLNSSSMVGWVNLEGQGRIRQFYAKGFTPSEIKVDEGDLPLTNVPPYVALYGASIYLAFQLKFDRALKKQDVLLAFSTRVPHHHRLTVHDDKTSLKFDFSSHEKHSTGNNVVDESSPSIFRDKRTHGTLAILAWGLFLPLGAASARYLKHRQEKSNNLWYFLHVPLQFVGFIFGISAVVVGSSLKNKLHAYIPQHKGIGVFVLVLTILQVMAFFWRPDKDSKYRKFWALYHNWFGRICLLFGAINIVLGIHVAGSGRAWEVGYGLLLAFTLVTVIVLETLLRIKRRVDHEQEMMKPHPALSMEFVSSRDAPM